MYVAQSVQVETCIQIYVYIRTFIVPSDRRPPVEEVKEESSMLRHPLAFLFSFMIHSSLIADRANLRVKCESGACLRWKFTVKILVT